MRSRSVLTALVTLAAGFTASMAARRFADRAASAVPARAVPAPAPAAPARDAVVLPFPRPVAPAPAKPSTPARCGDNGGVTKAGAPCGARGTVGGRCHHHRLAA